jgi:hypothetical protein
MLPALQTIIIVVSLLEIANTNLATVLGFLAGVSLLSLLVTPTLFSAETLASVYMKSLPLKRRTVVAAKTFLSACTYLGSVAAITIVALYLRKDFLSVLAFGLTQTLSVAAGCMMELFLLIRKFWWKELTPSTIYSSISIFIMVLLPGLILCLTPIMLCYIVGFTEIQLTLTIFLATATAELISVTSLTAAVIKD